MTPFCPISSTFPHIFTPPFHHTASVPLTSPSHTALAPSMNTALAANTRANSALQSDSLSEPWTEDPLSSYSPATCSSDPVISASSFSLHLLRPPLYLALVRPLHANRTWSRSYYDVGRRLLLMSHAVADSVDIVFQGCLGSN